jgi:hypothetical protein
MANPVEANNDRLLHLESLRSKEVDSALDSISASGRNRIARMLSVIRSKSIAKQPVKLTSMGRWNVGYKKSCISDGYILNPVAEITDLLEDLDHQSLPKFRSVPHSRRILVHIPKARIRPFHQAALLVAYLLHGYNVRVELYSSEGIIRELLSSHSQIDAVFFPGERVEEVQAELNIYDGGNVLATYVKNGGGYVGICSGAFLAGADGYDGANVKQRLVGAQTIWGPGRGEAFVKLTPEADSILISHSRPSFPLFPHAASSPNINVDIALSYCGGCCYTPIPSLAYYMDCVLPPATVLATYTLLSTHQIYWHMPDALPPPDISPKLEVCVIPAPAAMVCQVIGSGRVFASGPHPEDREETRWIIRAAFLWVLNIS